MGTQSRLVALVRFVDVDYDVGAQLTSSHSYSPQREILDYFKSVAKKYELYKYINLSHMVIGAAWDEDEGLWHIKVKDLASQEVKSDYCHFLINGSGILKCVSPFRLILVLCSHGYDSNWKWPDIPGIHSFAGELMHSAAWNDKYDLKGKKVAVLGCGSSGVQIVPTIQPGIYTIVVVFTSKLTLWFQTLRSWSRSSELRLGSLLGLRKVRLDQEEPTSNVRPNNLCCSPS
jgi:cation diffusion facilitator CzcD-associated flavoprotein CzcO